MLNIRESNKGIIHVDEGKWYFWDESWADRHGPFETQNEAEDRLELYCKEVLGIDTSLWSFKGVVECRKL